MDGNMSPSRNDRSRMIGNRTIEDKTPRGVLRVGMDSLDLGETENVLNLKHFKRQESKKIKGKKTVY